MQCNSGIWLWGHCLWCKKVKPVDYWMQYTVDAVCSGIVVFGGGDIVKGQTSEFSGCSHTVDTVHIGHSGHSMQ